MAIEITPEKHRIFKSCRKRFLFDMEGEIPIQSSFSVLYNIRNEALSWAIQEISEKHSSVGDFCSVPVSESYMHFSDKLSDLIKDNKLKIASEKIDEIDDFFEDSWEFLVSKLKILKAYSIADSRSISVDIDYGRGYTLCPELSLLLQKGDISIIVYIPMKKSERKMDVMTKLDFMMYVYGIHNKSFENIRGIYIDIPSSESGVLDVHRCTSDSIKQFKYDIMGVIEAIEGNKLFPSPKSSVCGSCRFSTKCDAFRKEFPDKVNVSDMESDLLESRITEMEW